MKERFLAVLLVIGLAAALMLGGGRVPGTAHAEESQMRLISVTGEAITQVRPDMATLSFGVETNASTALEAQQANSTIMNQVVEALAGAGIAREDIQTSGYSLFPVYEWRDDKPVQKQVLTGYRCSNTVVVKVRNLERIGQIIDRAASAGATNIGGIAFDLQNPDPLKNELLARAVSDARSKAEILARAAGVVITGVYRISDGWAAVDAGYWTMPLRAGAAEAVTPVEPGTITVRASVRIDFTF